MRESQQDGGECRNEATPAGTTEENDKLPDSHRLMHSQKPAKMSCNAALGGTCRLQVAGYLLDILCSLKQLNLWKDFQLENECLRFKAVIRSHWSQYFFPSFCAVNEDLPWSESWYTSAVGTLRTSQACWMSIGRSLRDVTESMISMPIFSLFFQTCLVFNPTTEAATQRP